MVSGFMVSEERAHRGITMFFFLFYLFLFPLKAESPSANECRTEDCAETQGGSAWQR